MTGSAAAPERLLLVGMMGSGKTTVGRALARQLGWEYVDSDAQVEAATGHSVAELFALGGEAAFRDAEAAVVRDAVAGRAPVVVAVAGGAVLRPDTRSLLRSAGTVVWLRARPDTLARRLGDGRDRPLLGDDPPAAIRRLDAERRPVYAALAQVVIDVDELDAPAVVAQVLSARGSGAGRAEGGAVAGAPLAPGAGGRR
ncbi:MAG TPA: shikimate kinase [Acidimicrobiales bacterium]